MEVSQSSKQGGTETLVSGGFYYTEFCLALSSSNFYYYFYYLKVLVLKHYYLPSECIRTEITCRLLYVDTHDALTLEDETLFSNIIQALSCDFQKEKTKSLKQSIEAKV